MKITAKQKAILKGMQVGTTNEVVSNPYTCNFIELSPEAVALYDIIKGSELTMRRNGGNEEIALLFDTALDVFIKNWPDAYMILLD